MSPGNPGQWGTKDSGTGNSIRENRRGKVIYAAGKETAGIR